MPALANPRWERFAQAIVEGLANGDRCQKNHTELCIALHRIIVRERAVLEQTEKKKKAKRDKTFLSDFFIFL